MKWGYTRSQSYKTNFGKIKSLFGVIFYIQILAQKLHHNLRQKNVFCCNSNSTKQVYRIEKVVYLNYANAKILALHSLFDMIGCRSDSISKFGIYFNKGIKIANGFHLIKISCSIFDIYCNNNNNSTNVFLKQGAI